MRSPTSFGGRTTRAVGRAAELVYAATMTDAYEPPRSKLREDIDVPLVAFGSNIDSVNT